MATKNSMSGSQKQNELSIPAPKALACRFPYQWRAPGCSFYNEQFGGEGNNLGKSRNS
jgi:hypothetical protein